MVVRDIEPRDRLLELGSVADHFASERQSIFRVYEEEFGRKLHGVRIDQRRLPPRLTP
jgi:hypothetical protein